ncbi:MAG: COP23 domain-containing protein [Cyanomargarita calcarea GSE-NOS-MK-12-04C]|jgi:hypothetical protein|uniref:COP23 domain-containing protein n=1 Tax=Cyanomargarita calcarea GSE-NOS-MK-12-04C TaxID=2839659 RepID=A0A951QSJ9_9CYAN|nr:COP23 domain-containing protein [Cyanomargarita calcarea GSE-NOS-MK-12-04C]
MTKTNFGTRLFATALAISSVLAMSEQGFSQTQQSSSQKTTFHCIRNGSGYATIARRKDQQTDPMITWNDTSFGSKFTPKERCRIVGKRLNAAIAQSGYSLSTLKLTHGMLRSNPVICYANNYRKKCDDTNLILTLNQSERGQEQQIIDQLKNFSVAGTGTPVKRSGGDGRAIAEFGLQIDKAFSSGKTQRATPELDVLDTESTTPRSVSTPGM